MPLPAQFWFNEQRVRRLARVKDGPQLPVPSGWFALAGSDEVKTGELLTRRFAGRDVIIFRTERGEAAVSGAHCPHLGASLAVGEVRGECLRCPFHGFEFNTAGECASIPGGGRLPKARLEIIPSHEHAGVIFGWYGHERQGPSWQIPTIDETGWTPIVYRSWRLRAHPQDITENGLDVRHFAEVHGYEAPRNIEPPVFDGPFIRIVNGMTSSPVFIKFPDTRFTITNHGLGYARVLVEIIPWGVQMRFFTFSTPTDEGWIRLTLATSVYEDLGAGRWRLRRLPGLPRRVLTRAALHGFFWNYVYAVSQDFTIWNEKIYIPSPRLAPDEAHIGRFRRWAAQFYPAAPAAPKPALEPTRSALS